jgi:chorismate lyase/3-hydroxybenzoate synthase
MPRSLSNHPLAHADPAPISVHLVPQAAMHELSAKRKDVLATIEFGSHHRARPDEDPRRIRVPLPPLEASQVVEVWRTPLPVTTGRYKHIQYCKNEDVLFAHLRVDEQNYANLNDATFKNYLTMLEFLRQQGYPHILRVWNYFNDINRIQGEVSRYQSFCLGRYRALKNDLDFETRLPASTVIGTPTRAYLIYLLAAKAPGIQLENPRQISAFRYPKQYGPARPSFSRATLKRWGHTTHLYISGTASIVGHQSRHRGHTLAQLDEILRNLSALIDQARRHRGLIIGSLSDLSLLKVYLHAPSLLPTVRQRLQTTLGFDVPVLLLQGDICRAELLLEIEGLYAH